MLKGNFDVDVREHEYFGSVTYYFHRETDTGVELIYPVLGSWQAKTVQHGALHDDVPHMQMSRQMAQRVYEALGKLFHPTKNVTEEQLTATQYHLEDMRALVFKKITS